MVRRPLQSSRQEVIKDHEGWFCSRESKSGIYSEGRTKVITERLDLKCERKGNIKMASKFLALTAGSLELPLTKRSKM